MTEFERYLFDLQGFLVIENVLNTKEIAALQSLLDQQIALQDNMAKFLLTQKLSQTVLNVFSTPAAVAVGNFA